MFSKALSVLITLFLASFVAQAAIVPRSPQNEINNGRDGRTKPPRNRGPTTTSSTTAAASATSALVNGNNLAATENDPNPQNSLTLAQAVIATGFFNNGQDVQDPGQVPSLTSENNFINFCLTAPGVPITNGKQIATGSCNPAPMGLIASKENMPSSKFTNPQNLATIKSNTPFTISMAIRNFEPGNFVNPQQNYFAAPQQLNAQGQIIGHSHVVIEAISSLTQTTPTDPKNFAFFKGLNSAAQGGVLTANVANGLPEGTYRLSSINAAANHQPVLVSVAQHGSLDDVVYFTVTNSGNPPGGGNSGNLGGNGPGNSGGAAPTPPPAAGPTTSTGTSTTTSVAAATTTKSRSPGRQ